MISLKELKKLEALISGKHPSAAKICIETYVERLIQIFPELIEQLDDAEEMTSRCMDVSRPDAPCFEGRLCEHCEYKKRWVKK